MRLDLLDQREFAKIIVGNEQILLLHVITRLFYSYSWFHSMSFTVISVQSLDMHQ